MVLTMAHPWKHPQSGIYWLRRRVPDDLRTAVGKREEKLSLRTREIAEAKVRHVKAMAELDARWANLRKGQTQLTERQAYDLAAPLEIEIVTHYADNPTEVFWDSLLGSNLWELPKWDTEQSLASAFQLEPNFLRRMRMLDWCRESAGGVLARAGYTVDELSRTRLERAVGAAAQRASLKLARLTIDGFEPSQSHSVRGSDHPHPSPNTRVSVSMKTLVEGWISERRPAAKTAYTWPRVADQFMTFLGHDDVAKITPEDLVRWKSALVAEGLAPKTIKDGKLAPIRTLLQWGADNRHLAFNAAERISIDVKRKVSESKRGYTDDEARLILKAAQKEKQAYRRWVPWICAYTGARIAEVCQLRVEDVIEDEGVWCFRFAPEAGALKNVSSERIVPVHSALLAEGFLTFVEKGRPGSLFPELAKDRFDSRGGTGTKILSRWVRSLGLDDPRISPSHSWRHRFKTLARRHDLALDIVDVISGHGRATVGDTYGVFPNSALSRELEKIPSILAV